MGGGCSENEKSTHLVSPVFKKNTPVNIFRIHVKRKEKKKKIWLHLNHLALYLFPSPSVTLSGLELIKEHYIN